MLPTKSWRDGTIRSQPDSYQKAFTSINRTNEMFNPPFVICSNFRRADLRTPPSVRIGAPSLSRFDGAPADLPRGLRKTMVTSAPFPGNALVSKLALARPRNR